MGSVYKMVEPGNSVETTKAPEWLSKLESRREKLTKGKIGHESGAGAPCNECGDKCPGLDLHFWRKVCQNCNCRKDQHMCVEDDSGWAQFEILGQIRSKPAYMKIKALAHHLVKLEWVPPNVAPDLVSDYMDKLESHQIPIAGSDAAAKRKQQLEFQVPPHDLDAEFCDNLTDSEAQKLQQYVEKVRENCVGQGNVVRVGDVKKPIIVNMGKDQFTNIPEEVLTKVKAHPSQIIKDGIIMKILNSEKIKNALLCEPSKNIPPKQLVISSQSVIPDFKDCSNLQEASKEKLKNLNMNKDLLKSAVENGEVYDNMINQLSENNIDISNDKVLGPISAFRKDYLNDDFFKKDIDDFMDFLNSIIPDNSTPTKSNTLLSANRLNSSSPVIIAVQPKLGSLMKEESPAIKCEECTRDIMLGEIAVKTERAGQQVGWHPQCLVCHKCRELLTDLVYFFHGGNVYCGRDLALILKIPICNTCDGLIFTKEYIAAGNPSFHIKNCCCYQASKEKPENLNMEEDIVKSDLKNEEINDNMNNKLSQNNTDFSDDNVLGPNDNVLEKDYLYNDNFKKDIVDFMDFLNGIIPDSSTQTKSSPTDRFNSSLACVEEMTMYPDESPAMGNKLPSILSDVNKDLSGLNISDDQIPHDEAHPIPAMKCKECTKDIMVGEVVVKAERAGKEIGWHPQCFVCHNCRELLADLVYFFHGGNIYCGRDLALILKIPRCNACDELIFAQEYTIAEDSCFHIKHFCCYKCDTPLVEQKYIRKPDENTNKPLCLNCYDEFYAKKCQRCQNLIGPSEQGVSYAKLHWHGECFLCAGIGCTKSLIGARFYYENDMLFCSPECVKSVNSN